MRHRRSLLLFALLAISWSLHASSTSFGQFPSTPPATAADAPGAPQNLSASVQGTTVDLAWTPPITGGSPSGYVVFASQTPGGAIVASVPVPGTGLTVPGVPPGTYFVHVRAQNGDGTSPPSNEVLVAVGAACGAPPNPPGTLQAGVQGNAVSLAWSAPAGGCPLTGYVLQAGSASGLSNVVNTAVGLVTGLGASAPPGTYFVRVLAVNGVGASAPSNEVAVTVTGSSSVPGAPVAFSASASGATASFSWSPAPAGGPPTTYLLEAAGFAGGPVIASIGVPGTALSVPNVPPGTYFVSVRGVNAAGAGPATAQQALTIGGTNPPCVPGSPSPPSANVSGTNAAISWNAVNGATSYRLDVGTAAGASNVLSEELSGTSRALTGLSNGSYFMRVTALNTCGAGTPSGNATFSIGVQGPTVTVTGTSPLNVGQSQQYTATHSSGGSSQNVTSTSAWSSTNTSVATVSSSGLVTAVAAGSADIRATFQGVTGSRTLQVNAVGPMFVSVTGPSPMMSGQSQQYSATAIFPNKSTQDVTGTSSWSSTNTAVATVNGSGLVTAGAAGSATIRATFQGVTGTRGVQVTTAAPTADFTWTTNADTLALGVNPGQCGVTRLDFDPNIPNIIRCSFDASSSGPGITTYTWEFEIQEDRTFNGVRLDGPRIQCGFPANLVPADVKLTVTSPGGTASITKRVEFVKVGAC